VVQQVARTYEVTAMNWEMFFGLMLLGGFKILFFVIIIFFVLLHAL
jgi:hypothetical protein